MPMAWAMPATMTMRQVSMADWRWISTLRSARDAFNIGAKVGADTFKISSGGHVFDLAFHARDAFFRRCCSSHGGPRLGFGA